MPRPSYRAVRDRFTHIDATFEGCTLTFDDRCEYRVAFYPWWEHPRYLEARRTGAPWGFRGAARRVVTVYPIEPVHFGVSRTLHVVDWRFEEGGPWVWPHEPVGQLIVNGPVDPAALTAALAARLAVTPAALADVTAQVARNLAAPSWAVRAPASVHAALRATLDALGVPHLAGFSPAPPSLVALVLDDTDVIVARDFELDVPDFEHRDEWFAP